MTCANIANLLTYRFETVFHLLHCHPYLAIDDIVECLNYCSKKKCIDDQPATFCCGCTLDTTPDEPPALFLNNDLSRINEVENIDGYAFLGTKEEYDLDRPQNIWELAEALLKKDEFK